MASEPNTPDSWAKLETRLLKKIKKKIVLVTLNRYCKKYGLL